MSFLKLDFSQAMFCRPVNEANEKRCEIIKVAFKREVRNMN